MKSFRGWMIALAVPALAACGQDPVDEAAILEFDAARFEQQFSAPVVIRASTATNAGDPAACALAQLVQTGGVRFAPIAEQEPYIALTSGSNSAAGGDVTLFSGRRRFSRSSEEERYSRESNEYFAHTVTYFIRGENSLLRPTRADGFGPFSIRLVYVRDPAVGHWRLESFTPRSGGETHGSDQGAVQAILAEVSQRGCPTHVIAAAAAAARTEALNRIERRLADSGVLARGPAPNTLVSRRNRRIWYIASTDMRGRRWRDMFTICNRVNVAAGRNWRPASLDDLNTLMTPTPNNNDGGVLVDTPDRRFFGSIPGTFITSSLLTYEGNPTTLAQANARRAIYQIWHYQRHYGQTDYRRDMSLTWEPGNYPLEYVSLLCVADHSG